MMRIYTYFSSMKCISQHESLEEISQYYFLFIMKIQLISLLIIILQTSFIIENMSIKTAASTIKNVLQDAVIRIPYFASTLRATLTLAFVLDHNTVDSEVIVILQMLKNQEGSLGYQCKLYYQKDQTFKSIIVQFQNVEHAKRVYAKYAKNLDKSYFSQPITITGNKNQSQYLIFFCKDITNCGVNMEEILFQFGKISVQAPESTFLREVIKQVAKFIVVQGIRGENELLRLRTSIFHTNTSNILDFIDPKYLSSESNYYRWKVYSYLQGDGDSKFKALPFQMTAGGSFYIPPNDSNEKYSAKILTYQERQYISKLLQTLTPRKFHIQEVMSFCISNISSAVQICCIICICIIESSQKLSEQDAKNRANEIKHLYSLFYLISDILFNSTSTIYRDFFTVLLPSLLEKLPRIPQLLSKIQQVAEIWNRKFIFEDQFFRGVNLILKARLPSVLPHGMEQMTRRQHQCYKDLIKIETPEEIEQLCWKYGITFSMQKLAETYRNLAAVLAIDKIQNQLEEEPVPGAYDGQPLTDKDLQKIKAKSCRVISCEQVPIKALFEKQKGSKSISLD